MNLEVGAASRVESVKTAVGSKTALADAMEGVEPIEAVVVEAVVVEAVVKAVVKAIVEAVVEAVVKATIMEAPMEVAIAVPALTRQHTETNRYRNHKKQGR